VQLRFPAIPDAARLEQRIRTDIPDALYFDDMHGLPDWRRHMTFAFAEEIRLELASAR
jgi:hypothetical protein